MPNLGLGSLEAAVMRIAWSADGDVTVRDVMVRLPDERTLAYTTVLAVMDKLFRKGLLDRERVGKAHAYRPTSSEVDLAAAVIADVLSDVRDPDAVLLRFTGTSPTVAADGTSRRWWSPRHTRGSADRPLQGER